MSKVFLAAASLLALVSCGGSSATKPITIDEIELTTSSFSEVSSNGTIDQELSGCSHSSCSGYLTDDQGNYAAYKIGIDPDGLDQFIALAGTSFIDAPIDDLPTQGQAEYAGEYRVLYIEDVEANETSNNVYQLVGFQNIDSGQITLTADFENSTLSGGSSNLSVDATFTGNELGGTVSYKSVEGDVQGQITSDQALAAFQGHDDVTAYAGAFIAYQ